MFLCSNKPQDIGVVWGVGVKGDPTVYPASRSPPVLVGRHETFIVLTVHQPGQAQLFVIVETVDSGRLAFGLGQGGEKHACQDGDDRDDHQ